MMNPIQAVARMQANDIKISSIVFWSILMSIYVFITILMHYIPNGQIMMGGANAIYIYSFIREL